MNKQEFIAAVLEAGSEHIRTYLPVHMEVQEEVERVLGLCRQSFEEALTIITKHMPDDGDLTEEHLQQCTAAHVELRSTGIPEVQWSAKQLKEFAERLEELAEESGVPRDGFGLLRKFAEHPEKSYMSFDLAVLRGTAIVRRQIKRGLDSE